MTDVIHHLHQKAQAAELNEYDAHWDSIYEAVKKGEPFPLHVLSSVSDLWTDMEANRNIFRRMAQDIAALQAKAREPDA